MQARVLIVEDEVDIMRILTHILTNAGYQVFPAYGGEDAIRKVKTLKPDLILTDLAMPKVSGVEVIDTIKGDPETAGIPIIAVTAHTWDGLAQSAGQVGCDAYISKPFSRKTVLEEVRKHLRPFGT